MHTSSMPPYDGAHSSLEAFLMAFFPFCCFRDSLEFPHFSGVVGLCEIRCLIYWEISVVVGGQCPTATKRAISGQGEKLHARGIQVLPTSTLSTILLEARLFMGACGSGVCLTKAAYFNGDSSHFKRYKDTCQGPWNIPKAFDFPHTLHKAPLLAILFVFAFHVADRAKAATAAPGRIHWTCSVCRYLPSKKARKRGK